MTLLTYLKLDTSDLQSGVGRANTAIGAVGSNVAGNTLAMQGSALATEAAANAMDGLAEASARMLSGGGALATTLGGAGQAAGTMELAIVRASNPAPLARLAQSARAAGAALEDAARHGQTLNMVQVGSKNGVPVYGMPGGGDPAGALKKVKPAADMAVQGVNAVTAASSLMSGSVQGAATGTIALSSALKGLNVAAATPIALVIALAAAVVMLAKAIMDYRARAARLTDSIQFGNAQSGIESLRTGFERLVETMDGAVGLMRELRALSREGMDIDADKRLARIELDRKRELAALDPADAKGAQAVNTRFDRLRTGAELDREAGANTAAAAEQRRQREENAAAIAERRAQVEALVAKAGAAATKATEFGSDSAGANSIFGRKRLAYDEEMTTKWSGVAKTAADEAARIRKEIEELERKNQVLEEQARIYEQRNEVVAIKREAAGIEVPGAGAEEQEQKKSGGISGALNVPTDRLTRIGGVTAGGFGAASGGGVAEKQFNETRRMREILERIARKEPGAVLG